MHTCAIPERSSVNDFRSTGNSASLLSAWRVEKLPLSGVVRNELSALEADSEAVLDKFALLSLLLLLLLLLLLIVNSWSMSCIDVRNDEPNIVLILSASERQPNTIKESYQREEQQYTSTSTIKGTMR